MECAFCGREIIEVADKVWRHIEDNFVYCEPGNSYNKGLAIPVGSLRS